MIKSYKFLLVFSIVAFTSLFNVISCASATRTKILAEENTTVQLLKIRELTFQRRYKLAEKLYREVQLAHATDTNLQIEIEYEVAFLLVKRGKYKQAKTLFDGIINLYDSDITKKEELPQWTYYLSKKILKDKIEPELAKTFWDYLKPPK